MPTKSHEEEYFVDDGKDYDIVLMVQKVNALVKNILRISFREEDKDKVDRIL